MSNEVDLTGVHATHCCVVHGCKYSDEDCPVVAGSVAQQYQCEECTEMPTLITKQAFEAEAKSVLEEFFKNLPPTGYRQSYFSRLMFALESKVYPTDTY